MTIVAVPYTDSKYIKLHFIYNLLLSEECEVGLYVYIYIYRGSMKQ